MARTMSDLGNRERAILKAVIQTYVSTAEAVSSRSIAKRCGFGLSAASIRNVMADLAEMGYLSQPHTSAGRVPTDLGYRFYVDSLMEGYEIDPWIRSQIEGELQHVFERVELVMEHTSKLLSMAARQLAVVHLPEPERDLLRYIQLRQLDGGRVLTIVVSRLGLVRSQVVPRPQDVTNEMLEHLTNFLNGRLEALSNAGWRETFLDEVTRDWPEAVHYAGAFCILLEPVIQCGPEGQFYLEGKSHIFEQPEFQDLRKVRAVLVALEVPDTISQLLGLGQEGQQQQVTITIGSENQVDEIRDCSVVTSTYCVGERPVGRLGVIGPTRMPYEHVCRVVEFTAQTVSRILTALSS